MKKILKLLTGFMAFTMTLTGCSASSGESGGKEDLIMGTGGTSGTYYIVGVAMGQTVSDKSEKANIIVQSSLGSMENINLTNINEMQLGFSNADGIYYAYNGTEVYEESGKQDILGVMTLYTSMGQMVTKANSGIKSYGDLKGKKVCLGPPSTTIIEMSKAILKAYGIDPEKDIEPYYLSFEEGITKVTDGELDATFFVAGTPTAALMNAASTVDMALVQADTEVLEEVVKEHPYFSPHIIPAGTYKGIDYDTNTLKIMTTIFTNSQTSEEAIYDFVKAALENIDNYVNSHEVVKEITPESAADMVIPLHPGAEKYYKEIGVLK
ncbi:TAXI family TRAP transporter solute-binding subunit [Alloiococcus sp. CFN-8]|uniref:TAXI family TRAP transporter solute-binding subunit n=1 Tax=Alloiococcus sp. CFN-8 TaxID=3416081 RepID=UPI003CFB0188